MKCTNCGSEKIQKNIKWGGKGNTGNVGLRYSLLGAATVYSDLCLDCGEIVRTYIMEDTDKDWQIKRIKNIKK
ncbi:hypothetical protein [Clostridioides sp. ZZV15-6598]|uniref:hypothetical protein n=1 Tax=Clostridioides sp. ZZV15-6598 TaxID=2811501 RepID=UPI001D11487F|nr:hypothetical protein [Clostridioides sp. ZZV15-6598]